MKKTFFYHLFFITIFVSTFLIRLLLIKNSNLAFTSDQARDMIAIRAIVHHFDLPLIGPITGIPGLYLGPFWFFFNIIPFVVSGGHPASLVIWQILWLHLSTTVLYFYFYKKNPVFALLSASLYLLSPFAFYTSRYSFNPHLLPAFTIFFFILLDSLLSAPAKGKKHSSADRVWKKTFLLGLLIGLSLQLEAATAIVFIPITVIFLLKNKPNLILAFIALFGTLLPQIIFEFRHHFIMTKVVIDQFTGKNDVIQNTLGFNDLIIDRFNSLRQIFTGTLPLPYFLTIILIITAIYQSKTKDLLKSKVFTSASFLVLIFFYLLFFLYPHPIKSWYLYPLSLPIIFLISTKLSKIPQLALIFLLLILPLSLSRQYQAYQISQNNPSLDPSNLNNRLQTIDKVYELADGQGFAIYNYLPSIYDYPYQYLFWWRGKKYNYHPEKITYQDNVPEYIPNNNSFLILKKPAQTTFLIIEEPESKSAKSWLEQFNLCQINESVLAWDTKIIQSTCSPSAL